MAGVTAENHTIGFQLSAIRRRWGWFLALGIGMLIAGGVAAVNLVAATFVSILYIATMMVAAGVFEVVHAFTDTGLLRRATRFAAGLVYAVAGLLAVYDPIMATVGFTLGLGLLLVLAGAFRLAAALHDYRQPGSGWLIASSVLTALVGILVLWLWPGTSLWLLGSILTVDLILQGWGFIAFALVLRSRLGMRHGAGDPQPVGPN